MYSVSKSFTSTAIGFAVEEGLLSLDAKVIDFFPEYRPAQPDEKLEKMTVRHLLTMTSGKNPSLLLDKTKDRWIKDFFNAPWISEPGEMFLYVSENIYMLCAILVRVTGISVTEFLTPRLYEPLGMPCRLIGQTGPAMAWKSAAGFDAPGGSGYCESCRTAGSV